MEVIYNVFFNYISYPLGYFKMEKMSEFSVSILPPVECGWYSDPIQQ